jgi:hypothetical protein
MKRQDTEEYKSLRALVRSERGNIRGRAAQARMVDVLVSLRYIAEEVNISYPVTDARAYYTWVAERSAEVRRR